MKRIKYILPFALLAIMATAITSCDDMLDMGNDDVLYADENHLTQGTDTVNSFVGILAQLQKIAVRTNLYGELRGDLVVVNANANSDLKEIANFSVTDDNAYNDPRDYYAVINNCNYYLANADTALFERRFDATTQSAYDFRVFQAEYCAVRAIRAWVYLQLGQIYGSNIPVITKPVLSLDDANNILSDASSSKMTLEQICDYFIDDLKPFVSWFAYPYHHNVYGYAMPNRMAVMPIQLVLGDLYLWSASIKQDQNLAREAAKSYYDYITWLPTEIGVDNNEGYKQKTVTSTRRTYWPSRCFTTSDFTSFQNSNNAYWSTTSFGTTRDEVITAIAMDSLASDENYNELRVLYNYDMENEDVEASISPSQACYDYSDGQIYAEYYHDGTNYVTNYVTSSVLTETQLTKHYLGDLRLPANISTDYRGDHDYESQMIWKTYFPQDVIIYRTGDVYLRMAEALNVAGFPKFALAILTTGLDNVVINHEVLSQCTTTADSTFVKYFDFPTKFFQTRVQSYKTNGEPNINSEEESSNVNQIGLHARGSGFSIANPKYYDPNNDAPADSTGYPTQPPVYNALGTFTSAAENLETILNNNTEFFPWAVANDGITILDLTTFTGTNAQKLAAVQAFEAEMIAYSDSIQQKWADDVATWYRNYAVPQVHARQVIVVDSLLDVESALETAFEGFRFGQLMRAAYRSTDKGTYMSQKLSQRDSSVGPLVSDPNKWFISWKGLIGL
ncbi:MAG: hypothetical protein K6C30_08230 [Bacteroidaceae bacterium]|nr:hypothetical protein [Bacteroidaceae bacterium]